MSNRNLGPVTLVAFLMLTQCVCGSNTRPTEVDAHPFKLHRHHLHRPRRHWRCPDGLDTKDLDDDEKRVLQGLLEEQYDPCGKARSFMDSLKAADSCPEASKLAALAVDKIAQGLSPKQVVRELLKEQARWAKKATFDLEGVPMHGTPGAGKKVVVEFFDYLCPHCKTASKPAAKAVDTHGAVLYYKMLPLQEIHPHAKEAALMALAANRQGKFSELHEKFFENQEILTPAVMRELAQKVGCDMAKLDADMQDLALDAQIARELKEATDAKITGTPTFYVDGYQTEFDQLEATLKGE